jgi:hypothetical protein
MMPETQQPAQEPASITDMDLEILLKRAIRNTLIIGGVASLVLWIASGWKNAAMMATGTAISAASIYEWRRLAHFITAKIEKKEAPRSAFIPVVLFLFRLLIFAGAIYVSLKCFQGSAIALLCGLGLAVLTLVWGAVGLLRN